MSIGKCYACRIRAHQNRPRGRPDIQPRPPTSLVWVRPCNQPASSPPRPGPISTSWGDSRFHRGRDHGWQADTIPKLYRYALLVQLKGDDHAEDETGKLGRDCIGFHYKQMTVLLLRYVVFFASISDENRASLAGDNALCVHSNRGTCLDESED
jgi:hypothetical protein